MEIITSRNNPLIVRTAALKDKKFRKQENAYIIEGHKLLEEAKNSGQEIRTVIAVEEFAGRYPDAFIVSESVFKKISDETTPQGVLAVLKIPDNTLKSPQNSCIFLDGVSDPGNMGTIIRTAAAAGYRDIYTVNCTDPFSPKAVRSSMGGIFHADIRSGSYGDILPLFKGLEVLAADLRGGDVFSFKPKGRFCICIGSEANGLSNEVRARSDRVLSIPMQAGVESLNAAVSAGIMMYILKNNI